MSEVKWLYPYSMGVEIEMFVTDTTGRPVNLDGYPELLNKLERFLAEKGWPLFSREPSADTLEFKTAPCASDEELERELSRLLKEDSEIAALLQENSLFFMPAGLNPASSRNSFELTSDLSGYFKGLTFEDFLASKTTNTAGVHLNFFLPYEKRAFLFPIVYALQEWAWPVSVIMQSSSVYEERFTNYMGARQLLWDTIHPARTGLVPEGLKSWQDFNSYINDLLKSGVIDKPTKIWWDVRPKPLDRNDPEKGFLIELRIADTADYERTLSYARAMKTVYDAILANMEEGKDSRLFPSRLLLAQTRENILRFGRNGQVLSEDGPLDLFSFAVLKLKPLIGTDAVIAFITALARPTLSESILESYTNKETAPAPLETGHLNKTPV